MTPLAQFVVTKLTEPYLRRGRNTTKDNFFTGIPFTKKLLTQDTTLFGIVRANKKESPKPTKGRNDKITTLFSSLYYKLDNSVLTIYQSKSKVKVWLLIVKRTFAKVEDNCERASETILYSSAIKFKYSVKASLRWFLRVFYNILHLAVVNSWKLYEECTEWFKNI